MKDDMKTLLLAKGAEIIHRKGYNNTGINEILKAAGAPKGSFYHYFQNKEDFGFQLIEHYMGRMHTAADTHIVDESQPYLARFRKFLDSFLEYFERCNYEGGCPIGNLTQELADINEGFRSRLGDCFLRIREKFALFLEGAKSAGELPKDLDVPDTADFILNSWEGALLRMKVTKNSKPMDLFYQNLFKRILA
jgi:TetR/AcrR family transcriptional repressor of nem operon